MKIQRNATSLTAAAFFLTSAAALAQYEGVAEFRGTTQTDKNQAIPSRGKVFASKSAVRVEWEMNLQQVAEGRKEAGKGAMPNRFGLVIIQKLSEPDRAYVLNDRQKTYAVDMIDDGKDKTAPERTWSVKRLGRDTVGGLSCEKAILTAEDRDETEVCVSTELIPSAAWLRAWNRREEQSSPLKALKEKGLNGFPIRWIFRSGRDEKIASTVELVRFDRKSLPGSLFEVPPGYRKVGSVTETMMSSDQSQQYQDALKKMQADLDKMTPEQRKAVEELLKQQRPDRR